MGGRFSESLGLQGRGDFSGEILRKAVRERYFRERVFLLQRQESFHCHCRDFLGVREKKRERERAFHAGLRDICGGQAAKDFERE